MVDAGFNDLVRPAMCSSYHHISIVGRGEGRTPSALVAPARWPKSGDVFTRDDKEYWTRAPCPAFEPGRPAGPARRGRVPEYTMSSNYVSIGRVPQVFWDAFGRATLVSRRESIDDVMRAECDERL